MVDVLASTKTTAVLETALGGSIGTYSGAIETVGDHDWNRVTLVQGATYNFFLALQKVGVPSGDPELFLRNAAGVVVANNDDANVFGDTNSFVSYVAPTTGTYYLDVFDHANDERGAYSVLMTAVGATNVFKNSAADNVAANPGERIAGMAGDDTIDLSSGGIDALGEQGNDLLLGNALANTLSGGLGNDDLVGYASGDVLFGDAGDDLLRGETGPDQLFGGDGLDDLLGGSQNDRLNGGGGTDLLTGGTERDFFIFKSVTDSVVGSLRDQILDFDHNLEHDLIDVSAIDASTHKIGNQKFAFISGQLFHHHDGELRYSGHVLQGDVNGDGKADFEISVNVTALLSTDFNL